jgi:site-specific recombinase XerD
MTRKCEKPDADVGEAVESFLSDKSIEYADSTIYSYRSRLGHFVEFCQKNNINSLEQLEPADIDRYKSWRFDDHALETVKTQMDSLRMLLEWCEKRGYVQEGIPDVCESPHTRGAQRSDIVRHDRQKAIVDHLEKFRYASLEHVIIALLSHTGLRAGAVRGLDVADVNIEEQSLDIVHRPSFGTPLKNKESGERKVAISERMCDILSDYIENTRHEQVVDGRKPLLTTSHGRISRTALRETAYRWTQPCQIGRECPHGKDPDKCEFTQRNHASKCESSSATHAFRRGVITSLLQDTSEEVVGGRCDVTRRTMNAHYDMRSEEDKMSKRREELGI